MKNNNEVNNKLGDILRYLHDKVKGNGCPKYSKSYNNLHPNFKKRILSAHPNLTPKEVELSKMIRIGLSTKELAGLMFVTPESMRVTRSRLRKKLKLNSE